MTKKDELLRHFRARLKRQLFLGRGKHTGTLYYLNPDDYRATHFHLIGASNFGKSFYLEHLLRSFTDLRIAASIIDPHGDRARSFLQFLIRNPRLVRERKIVHFAPGSPSNTIGFNPFLCNLTEPAEIASLVLEAFVKVWGQQSFNEAPRLERILRTMFHAFASNGVELTESYQFLLVDNRAFRQKLLAEVADERVRQSWHEIEQLPKAEKVERFESSFNRLQRFLSIPAVANVFEANGNSIRFNELFSEGKILVADLSQLRSTEAQSLIGTMLVNSLYHAAKRRAQSKRDLWVLAIDEFPQFVTTDVARGLDELRKFGVRLILAHQRLAQLPDDLRSAVLTNAAIRAVFGGLSREDAEILARELFTGEVTGNRIKHVARQTKFRPVLVEREIETHSESSTEGRSESDGWSEGSSSGTGSSFGTGSSYGFGSSNGISETDDTVSHLFSSSDSYGSSDGYSSGDSSGSHSSSSRASGTSSSSTQGYSRTTAYVTEHKEFREETGRQFRTTEEEWEKLTARVFNLGRREVLVKVFNQPVRDIITPDVKQYPARPHKPARRPKRKGATGGKPEPPKPPTVEGNPNDFWEPR